METMLGGSAPLPSPSQLIVMRTCIDQQWTNRYASHYLSAIEFLYEFEALFLNLPTTTSSYLSFSAVRQFATEQSDPFNYPIAALFKSDTVVPTLRLLSYEFASPGHQDFLGFGKALEQVRLIIQSIIDMRHGAQMQAVALERAKEEVEAIKLKNLDAKLDILKKAGAHPQDIAKIAYLYTGHLETIDDGALTGRLVSVELRKPPKDAA